MRHVLIFLLIAAAASACGSDDAATDTGPVDSSVDAMDSAPPDAADTSVPDAADTSVPDAADAGPTPVTFPPRDFVCATPGVACETTEPARTEAERTVVVPADMAPSTFTFLFATLSLPQPGSDATGLNLDGLDSASGSTAKDANCEQFNADYPSAVDALHVGVDSAFNGLLLTLEALLEAATCPGGVSAGCFDAELREGIRDGSNLVLVEVEGVDSFTYDPEVSITVYEGVGTPMIGGDARPTPGQTIGTGRTIASTTTGDIFDGRLRVVFSDFDFSLASVTDLLDTSLSSTELRADVSSDGLANGVLASAYAVDALAAAAEAAAPGTGATMRSVYESVADVRPSADPTVCEELSVGLAFDGVVVERSP